MNILFKTFNELTQHELYDILTLRAEVFVVEQNCIYNDLDGKDEYAIHLLVSSREVLVAYLRILPAKTRFEEVSLGRVVVNKNYRKKEFGKRIMRTALREVEKRYGKVDVRISAQKYLMRFYKEFGFKVDSEDYLEDGIPHVEMIYSAIRKV